jgi:hypothetical protein
MLRLAVILVSMTTVVCLAVAGQLIAAATTPIASPQSITRDGLPVALADIRRAFTLIARFEGVDESDESVLSLAAASRMEPHRESGFPTFYVVEARFFENGSIYDKLRGASGNGNYYILKGSTGTLSVGATPGAVELVGAAYGNSYRWTTTTKVNDGRTTLLFVTSERLGGSRTQTHQYAWDGRIFRPSQRLF